MCNIITVINGQVAFFEAAGKKFSFQKYRYCNLADYRTIQPLVNVSVLVIENSNGFLTFIFMLR